MNTLNGDRKPHIAIVGSGPAGCYTAQALVKDWPRADITVIDRLPVPYGLVRYGVAPDHQGTKSVIRQFDRLFDKGAVAFAGNVHVGVDVALADLRKHHDAVILATGLSMDRTLGIVGEDLPGVYGAGQLTRMVNDHPDEHSFRPVLGERVAIIGHGNVALDLLRLLAKRSEDFDGTDLGPEAYQLLHEQPVRHIVVVGRGAPHQAKFDPAMVKELAALEGVRFSVEHAPGSPIPSTQQEDLDPVSAAIEHLLANQRGGTRVSVRFCFGWRPVEVIGRVKAGQVLFATTAPGRGQWRHSIDSVIKAVGFDGTGPLMPPSSEPDQDGRLEPGLYCVGWARRGGRGTIPDARNDGKRIAAAVTADLRASSTCSAAHNPNKLRDRWNAVDFAAWQRIDQHEQAAADDYRIRRKVRHPADLMRVAGLKSPNQGDPQ